jgi:hypothetical protein
MMGEWKLFLVGMMSAGILLIKRGMKMVRGTKQMEAESGTQRGKGRKGGPSNAGPGGNCLCPKCNYAEPHMPGEPCKSKKCPKCGTLMIRE